MRKPISTKSRAKPALLRWLLSLVIFLLPGCTLPLTFTGPDTPATGLKLTPLVTIPASTAVFAPTPKPEVTLTASASVTPTRLPPLLYTTQSGDSLANLAGRFGIRPEEINSAEPVAREGLLNPGQLLLIPRTTNETAPSTLILPDSEVVYSPAALDFDIKDYVQKAGGYLSSYKEFVYNQTHTGAEIVQIVATENSINPRLLLALLEERSHWVLGQPGNMAESEYPLGDLDVNNRALYKQLAWGVRQLMVGYYGWRAGTLNQVTYPDGTNQRLAPEVNAGTAAVEYFYAKVLNRREWAGVLFSNSGFPALYEKMFDSPWARAQIYEPLFPPGTVQPQLELPFQYNRTWSFTGGPHAAWSTDSPRAALDFAPGSTESGCIPSQEWVLAAASGLVVRSDNAVVVVDLDGDGKEQTGWVLLYLHIATEKRVPVGTRLNVNDNIGHPSCEGGVATGTHFHIARKFNGEWILADGPLPFVLGGWRAHNGSKEYDGTLTQNGQTITACTCGSAETKVIRPRPNGP